MYLTLISGGGGKLRGETELNDFNQHPYYYYYLREIWLCHTACLVFRRTSCFIRDSML